MVASEELQDVDLHPADKEDAVDAAERLMRFDGALPPEISVEVASKIAPIFVRLRKTVMVSAVKYRMVMQ